MNIPNFVDAQMVDKDGKLTAVWKQILMQLFTEMQVHLSEEGFRIPQQTTDNISKIESAQTTGNIIYDKTTKEAKINIDGAFKVIQVI